MHAYYSRGRSNRRRRQVNKAQQYNNELHPSYSAYTPFRQVLKALRWSKLELTYNVPAGLGQAIAAGGPVSPWRLEVNSD